MQEARGLDTTLKKSLDACVDILFRGMLRSTTHFRFSVFSLFWLNKIAAF